MKPKSWDLVIGVLWSRFGSSSGAKIPGTSEDYGSGTYEEFRIAYELWKTHQRPRILMDRGMHAPDMSRIQGDQPGKVQSFFKDFRHDKAHPGLLKTYESSTDFLRLIQPAIGKFIDNLPDLTHPADETSPHDADAPKVQNKPAQGNALGFPAKRITAL